MPIPYMIAMHMADQDHINSPKAGIIRPGNSTTGIIQNARSIRIFKDHRPVKDTKFPIMTAQWGDFHSACLSRRGTEDKHDTG